MQFKSLGLALRRKEIEDVMVNDATVVNMAGTVKSQRIFIITFEEGAALYLIEPNEVRFGSTYDTFEDLEVVEITP